MIRTKMMMMAAAAFMLSAPAWAQDTATTQSAPVVSQEAGHDGHKDHKGHGERGKHLFEKTDADGDGRISRDEFLKRHVDLFEKSDKDSDGYLSADEVTSMREEMKKHFKDRKGKFRDKGAVEGSTAAPATE